jgi:hypothetical protein
MKERGLFLSGQDGQSGPEAVLSSEILLVRHFQKHPPTFDLQGNVRGRVTQVRPGRQPRE